MDSDILGRAQADGTVSGTDIARGSSHLEGVDKVGRFFCTAAGFVVGSRNPGLVPSVQVCLPALQRNDDGRGVLGHRRVRSYVVHGPIRA